MRTKNIIRITLLTPIAIYLLYSCYFALTNEINPSYLDCGEIVSKSSDEVVIKYGVKTELYLNIEFNKSGFRSIECEPSLYFKKKIGDEVCFNLIELKPNYYYITIMFGWCVLGVTMFLLFIKLVMYLVPDDLD